MNDLDNLSVLSSLSQTSGRGQGSNTWLSSPGENLTFSVILKYGEKPFMAKDQIIISALTAITVTELLTEYEIESQIKWPNDIYVGENKICGILIEHSVKGNKLSNSIVGIGLNVNQRNFDVSLPNPTSIATCKGDSVNIDIRKCLDCFMDIYKRNLRLLDEDRDFSKIYELYMSKLREGSPIDEINRAWLR